MCSCCGLEAVRWASAQAFVQNESKGAHTAVKAQQGWTTKAVFVVWLLLNISCSVVQLPIQSLSVDVVFALGRYGSVLTVVMMLFGHHRRHKVGMWCMFIFQCCCFSFIFASIILRRVVWSVARFASLSFVCVCFIVSFEQIDVLFCSMKFRCVIAGAFGVGVFWMHSVATSVA